MKDIFDIIVNLIIPSLIIVWFIYFCYTFILPTMEKNKNNIKLIRELLEELKERRDING